VHQALGFLQFLILGVDPWNSLVLWGAPGEASLLALPIFWRIFRDLHPAAMWRGI
jgi:hypothetical protein